MIKVFIALLLLTGTAFADTVTHGLTIPTTHPRLGGGYINTSTTNCTADVAANKDRSTYIDGLISSGSTTFDDVMRWSGENVVQIFDRCYNVMSSGDKSTYIETWNYYFSVSKASYMGQQNDAMNNYFWGTLRNFFEWGVTTYEDNVVPAESFLDGFLTRWNIFVAASNTGGSKSGGYPGEGSQYGRYAPTSYSVIPQLTANAMGRNLYSETSFFKAEPFFLIYATPMLTTTNHGWQLFSGSDDEVWMNGDAAKSVYWGDWMTMAAIAFDGTDVEGYSRKWLNLVNPSATLITDPGGSTKEYTTLSFDFYATGPKYLWGRSTWNSDSTVFHLTLAGASGHGHQDMGSWQLWKDGYFVSRESVGYASSITGYSNSGSCGVEAPCAHNSILVNADCKGCTAGVSCIGNGGMAILQKGNAVVSRLESTTGYSYAQTDLTDEYITSDDSRPYRGNPAVGIINGSTGHVEREFVYIRGLDTLVILDRILSLDVNTASASTITKTFLAHCETNPTLEDATHVICSNGTQVMRITTLVPSTPTSRTIVTEGGESSQYRIEINDYGNAQSYFLTVIQTRSTSDANITASVVDSNPASTTSGTFTVTLIPPSAPNTVIVFNKGQTSSGGTISLAGASAVPLATGVQGITYTDNGPVWITGQCGDSQCSGGETCTSCQADCGECPTCGDTVCNGTETCVTCPGDCGTCPPPPVGGSSGGSLNSGTWRDTTVK